MGVVQSADIAGKVAESFLNPSQTDRAGLVREVVFRDNLIAFYFLVFHVFTANGIHIPLLSAKSAG